MVGLPLFLRHHTVFFSPSVFRVRMETLSPVPVENLWRGQQTLDVVSLLQRHVAPQIQHGSVARRSLHTFPVNFGTNATLQTRFAVVSIEAIFNIPRRCHFLNHRISEMKG